jgi:prophage maintenance system killer protein
MKAVMKMTNPQKPSREKVRRRPLHEQGAVCEPAAAYTGPGGEILLYRAPDGKVCLDVRLDRETVWLTQKQMAALFQTERSVITKHLRNIFASGELDKDSVSAFFAHTAADGKTYRTQFYNLDAIISVGYRVNSKRGTQFRIWATQVLRDHLVKGYTVNARRLEALQQTIQVVANFVDQHQLSGDEATALLRVIRDYARGLSLLEDYDQRRILKARGTTVVAQTMSLEEAHQLIDTMRNELNAGELFGRERGDSLAGILGTIFQTALGTELYPTLEDKAAHLLYFVVKDHPFVDGNKRIGAALFLRFLDKNGALYMADRTKRVSEEALVAITLLLAESRPADKDILIRLVVALLNRKETKP